MNTPIPEGWVETPWHKGEGWVSCDFCNESYLDDVCESREIRKFYKSQNDDCIACEYCVHDTAEPEEAESP